MASHEVKQITEGRDKGKWGVYRGNKLLYVHATKSTATRDANRRNSESK
jgi:hypothetical protein